jgi:CheY-like chemotaxis protein
MQFVLFNKDIDMCIVVYPNEIEKQNLDASFIQTYKTINRNDTQETFFIAGIAEGYYPNNRGVFDKIINAPINLLDVIEVFSEPHSTIETYRYLIIDDEPLNRKVLTSLIKTLDKTAIIETANDGVEGLEKLKNSEYDLVFLDKRMPKMDGYQVLEELKKLNIKTKIYLLTADGDSETIEKAKEYNAGYISKPVSLSILKSVIINMGKG